MLRKQLAIKLRPGGEPQLLWDGKEVRFRQSRHASGLQPRSSVSGW